MSKRKHVPPAPVAPAQEDLAMEDRVLDVVRKIAAAMAAIEGIRDSPSEVDRDACDGLWWLLSDARTIVEGFSAEASAATAGAR